MRMIRSIVLSGIAALIISACNTKQKDCDSVYENLAAVDNLIDVWKITGPGEITWEVKGEKHSDQIEMSGLRVSGIISYGVDENGGLVLSKRVVWPMLRRIPNDTHASLIHWYGKGTTPKISVNGKEIETEQPERITFNGILSIYSSAENEVGIKRELFPSVAGPAIVEIITVTNRSSMAADVKINSMSYQTRTPLAEGVYGAYTIEASCPGAEAVGLRPEGTVTATVVYSAIKEGEKIDLCGTEEKEKREVFARSLFGSLDLETPDPVINEMFRFAKLRATESIYATKGGLMHGPGGGRYYAAIWANDQAEYVNPFFPFLGNKNGNESAINSFRHFARFVNPGFNPVPSSIIAEGVDIWNGSGDRGDAAMIAYGASRFALAYGDKKTADSLLPLIKWCLEYCEKKMLPEGVIASDCDELENRFPAGEANLSTNMLAYGGYLSTANLLRALIRDKAEIEEYNKKAIQLWRNCEEYFGGNIQGFDTYKYFKENEKLRSWICLPLVMGINDRKTGTLKALLSPYLWNKDGIFTEAGDSTFWDRATLYAFRGIFYAGETDTGMKYFRYYSQKRLLGKHVPYAVEAYPEGNQRHLSAESGLYCRVITEGLFGIEPTGFDRFECAPRLPSGWDYMKLKHIRMFQRDFDLAVERKDDKILVTISSPENVIEEKIWNGKDKIEFTIVL